MWYEEAKKLRSTGLSYNKISDQLNIHLKTVQSRFKRDELRGNVKNNIIFEDKKPEPTIDDVQSFYESLKSMECAISTLDTKQTKMTISLDEDKPIGVAFWGDWHIGARGVDYEEFDRQRKAINETDGLYFVGMGDYKDNQNALVHASGTTEQTIVPGMQDLLVKSFFIELKEKALAIIRGCHDDWDKKTSDKDFIQTLCSKEVADCVNLWHGGGINIKLGSVEYKIRARHKYKNESSLNTTNSQRNMLNDFGPCDVIALAHKHYSDLQMLKRMGQDVIYMRSGTNKVYDEYGQKLAGYVGQCAMPIIVIYPDKKCVVPFKDYEKGIRFLQAERR